MIFIFDIDGTVADITHRLHFIGADAGGWIPSTDQTKDWDGFSRACVDDKPIFETITVARALASAGHTIVYSTGRSSSNYDATVKWLTKFRLPSPLRIYMRPHGDHREDYVVKSEILDQIFKDYGSGLGGYGGAFEDRQQVVDMYRERGLRVFQVAKGNF